MLKLLAIAALISVTSADVSHLFRKPISTLQGPSRGPSADRLVALSALVHGNPVAGRAGSAQILRTENDSQPDGSYSWYFETDNGISAQEQAYVQQMGPGHVTKAAQGSFSWTSPEGQPIRIVYIADENGYQPQGDLPTPPPIPVDIQKALDWIAANPPKELIRAKA